MRISSGLLRNGQIVLESLESYGLLKTEGGHFWSLTSLDFQCYEKVSQYDIYVAKNVVLICVKAFNANSYQGISITSIVGQN